MEYAFVTAEKLSPGLQSRVRSLFGQLTDTKEPLQLHELLNQASPFYMLCCHQGDELLGMATLCTYEAISGKKGWIEDVVVDEKHRGKGIGKGLMKHLMEKAKQIGLQEILLFTGQHRETARRMYEGLGFSQRNSSIFIYHL